jgi:hypothetical protein
MNQALYAHMNNKRKMKKKKTGKWGMKNKRTRKRGKVALSKRGNGRDKGSKLC